MKTHTGHASAVTEQATARAATTVGKRGLILLTETELERVAAAGRKKGIAPGNDAPPPRPH